MHSQGAWQKLQMTRHASTAAPRPLQLFRAADGGSRCDHMVCWVVQVAAALQHSNSAAAGVRNSRPQHSGLLLLLVLGGEASCTSLTLSAGR